MKILVNKMVGDGEQFSIEVNVEQKGARAALTAASIMELLRPALEVVDARLLELNMRIIEHNNRLKRLPAEAQLGVRESMEVLYGRRLPGVAQEAIEADRLEQAKALEMDPELAEALTRAREAADEGSR